MAETRFGGRTAVVMGGSMAGLVAARALADHFAEVTIIERDRLPDSAAPHKGVPQGRHAHGLLGKGEEVLNRFFPDLRQDLIDHGAVVIDSAKDVRFLQGGAWKARFHSGLDLYFLTRPLLEWRVRTHLARVPNVKIQEGVGVRAFRWNDSRTRVTGIDTDAGPFAADLVVDATGRGSRTADWLEQAGLGKVTAATIHTDVTYATRLYRKPANGPDWKFLLQLSSAPEKRLGWMGPTEGGNHWLCTLLGYHGESAPTDHDGYLAFAKSLPVPDLYEAIAASQPESEITTFKSPSSVRRHYDRMARFPDGLAVLGDAACCFNPVYGQGMTVAALGAATLHTVLAEQAVRRPGDLTGFAARFQKQLAAVTMGAWMAVATDDFRYPETAGDKLPGTGFMRWYFDRLHPLMATDEEIHRTFLMVMHMYRPGTDMLSPRIFWKALTSRVQRPATP